VSNLQLPEKLFEQAVVGPSYGKAMRWLLIGFLLQTILLAVQSRPNWPNVPWEVWVMIGLASVVILTTAWSVLLGKTTIDHKGIRKQVAFGQGSYDFAWRDIAGVRLVRLPFLGTRLLVKGQKAGPAKAFHAGDAQLLEAFERLSTVYKY
jgi:hypothetical protein